LHGRTLVLAAGVVDLVGCHQLRSEHVGRGEHRLGAQGANAGLVERALIALGLLLLLLPPFRLDLAATLLHVGRIHVAGGVEQPSAILQRQRLQQRTVGHHRFQQRSGGSQLVTKFVGHEQGM
jgi:hypothetical protein